ncbi:MAG: aminopeptidase P N-terminal domain-containing protein, partial [Acidobacteria bacterium]|nr:aminopeptidase P N-terminal domain-containing protein [Acidobacteriota bacterium]
MKRLPAAKALALRRRRLMGRLGSRDVALLSAAPETFHSNDVEHRYRPDSDLFYLTGFSEPGAVAVLAPGHRHGDFWLVVRPRDPAKETWTGPRAGVQGARAIYGAAVARPLDALEEVVEQVLARAATLYHMPGRDPALDRLLRRLLSRRRRAGKRTPRSLSDVRPLVHEMRLKKEREEVAHMRHAAFITCRAHLEGMALAAPGLYEYQVEARIDCTFRTLGAQGSAYPTIVGSGPNGVVLHHVANQRR